MGQDTCLTFGASAVVDIKASTIAKLRCLLSRVENENLHDRVMVYEQTVIDEEEFIQNYYDYREYESVSAWLEPPDGFVEDEFDWDAFHEAFGNSPRIIFMAPCMSTSIYTLDTMRNPFVFNTDNIGVDVVISELEKGRSVLEHLGFDPRSISVGNTIRNAW